MLRAASLRPALTVALVAACTHARPGPLQQGPADTDAAAVTDEAPLSAPTVDPPAIVDHEQPQPGPPRWRPLETDPRLVLRDGSDELGFLEQPCAVDEPCGCLVAAEHRYHRRGDGWTIVVVLPEVEIRRVVKRGTCLEGCGQPHPPEPTPIRSLGAVDPAKVEIVVKRPRKVITKTTCTDPHLAP
ncbi:hypothetical protein [Nannocystis bainbridge]|uniref:Secreted protein n=1 Tax=Nannocystis bainbridge TaxID=2995303 RepID=A0ABT5DSU4_9BACT|nr:hypothetical protein [Nannocystis bainbridge]MDC0716712.1 hypothetical protein [Nannocystis bainbridge]